MRILKFGRGNADGKTRIKKMRKEKCGCGRNSDDKIRMEKCGWKNEDNKMRTDADDN